MCPICFLVHSIMILSLSSGSAGQPTTHGVTIDKGAKYIKSQDSSQIALLSNSKILHLTRTFSSYNRKGEVERERLKTKQARNNKSSTFTQMAHQHHYESLSQHF